MGADLAQRSVIQRLAVVIDDRGRQCFGQDARVVGDKLMPASELGARRFSQHFLDIIDWCLELDPRRRPQSVFALQKALVEAQPRSNASTRSSLMKSLKNRLSK